MATRASTAGNICSSISADSVCDLKRNCMRANAYAQVVDSSTVTVALMLATLMEFHSHSSTGKSGSTRAPLGAW